jgi:hypothetical protein
MVSAIASILTVLKVYAYSGWLIALAVPIFAIIYYLDNRYSIRGEFDYQNRNNLEWQETRNEIKEIKRMLEANEDH